MIVRENLGQFARVTGFAKCDIDWQSAQVRNGEFFGLVASSTTTKDVVGLAAIRASEAAHVFDHAGDRNVDFAEHTDGFDSVQQSDFLRGANHDGTRDRDRLRKRQRDVAGARWHVDDQVIQFAPRCVTQELLNRTVQHRTTPNHGLVRFQQETHRHDRHCTFGFGWDS